MGVEVVTRSGSGWMIAAIMACSRPNPAFDDAAPQSTSSDGTGGPGPGSSLVTTDSDPSETATTATTTAKPTTTESTTTSGDDTSGAPSETGAPRDLASACPEGPGTRLGLSVVDLFTGTPIECGDLELLVQLDVTDGGSSLVLEECDGVCPCMLAPTAGYEIDLDEQLVSDAAAGCRLVRIWTALTVDDACEWAGFAVHPADDGLPFFAAANRAGAPTSVLDGGPTLADGALCPDHSCDAPSRQPGLYALQLAGVSVWPEDPETVVPFENATYDFDNRMSHVTEECVEHVSWWAERQ